MPTIEEANKNGQANIEPVQTTPDTKFFLTAGNKKKKKSHKRILGVSSDSCLMNDVVSIIMAFRDTAHILRLVLTPF